MSYTEGAWRVAWDLPSHGGKSSRVWPTKGSDLYEPIAIIPHDDMTEEGWAEVQGNARLIAAAPDLLESLKDAMSFATEALELLGSPDDAVLGPRRQRWADTIAKAEAEGGCIVSRPYAVHGGDRAGPVEIGAYETFDEALEVKEAKESKDLALSISNTDRCDFCSVDGWDDGLTEDERERLS